MRHIFVLAPLILGACVPTTGGKGGAGMGDTWVVGAHPCDGYRTDTLWVDDDATIWLGCGTDTTGFGLFRSTDEGAAWSRPTTDPAHVLDDFRVDSVSRSADGLLYVAGTGGDARVLAVDTTAEPYAVTSVLEATGQSWNEMQVGTFRRTPSGFAVAESLTGYDVAWRASDDTAFADGYGWWGEGDSVQILDLVEYDGSLYGSGSTIAQPPQIFVPGGGEGPGLVPLVLDEDAIGELESIAVDAGGIVAGGVDEDVDEGVLYLGPPGASSAADFTRVRIGTWYPREATRVRGTCRQGDAIAAVGEYPEYETGLVLVSTDGGVTFTDLTPSGVPALHRCTFDAGGRLHVAGGHGYYAWR